jgi:hypothetical protein
MNGSVKYIIISSSSDSPSPSVSRPTARAADVRQKMERKSVSSTTESERVMAHLLRETVYAAMLLGGTHQ